MKKIIFKNYETQYISSNIIIMYEKNIKSEEKNYLKKISFFNLIFKKKNISATILQAKEFP